MKVESGGYRYHLTGAGGVGMSALARLLLGLGNAVSGSERACVRENCPPEIKKLQAHGFVLTPQTGAALSPDLTALVTSAAVEADNPELVAARRLGIPILRRAELLAKLAADHRLVAVAGTAGKTTVTGMVGWTLTQLGADPTVVNGGALLDWTAPAELGSVRLGHSDLWVLELDESDRSLLLFNPDWALVTNMSRDHFPLAEVRTIFDDFRRRVKQTALGPAPGSDRVRLPFEPELAADSLAFEHGGARFQLPLPGRHNAENAYNCARLCEALGYSRNAVAGALASFHGIHRRLESVGTVRGVRVVDDYAHNPEKIAAAWRALAPYHRRLIAVWRPHGFGPLRLMFRELQETFLKLARPQDRIVVLPVYDAGGTADRSLTASDFVAAGRRANPGLEYCERPEILPRHLLATVCRGDAVVFLGARDPDLPLAARRFVRLLEQVRDGNPA